MIEERPAVRTDNCTNVFVEPMNQGLLRLEFLLVEKDEFFALSTLLQLRINGCKKLVFIDDMSATVGDATMRATSVNNLRTACQSGLRREQCSHFFTLIKCY